MPAFITNFQSPVEMEDLEDRFNKNGITSLDMILGHERYMPLEWTVDKDADIGDTVYFMCAKTSVDHMGHLCALLRKSGKTNTELYQFAQAQKANYQVYASCIVAVGRVASKPFQTAVSGWAAPHWRSHWYAKIDEIELLGKPISISAFRDFIKVSTTGAITKLSQEQQQDLEALISAR